MTPEVGLDILRQLTLHAWQRLPAFSTERMAQIIANIKYLCPSLTRAELIEAMKKGIEQSKVKLKEDVSLEVLFDMALGIEAGTSD